MSRHRRVVLAWMALGLAAVVLPGLGPASAAAQVPARPGARAQAPPAAGPLTPVEIQRLFDDYVVVQARGALALTDLQRPEFLKRLRELQQVRRRNLQRRRQIIQELARATAQGAEGFDEARVRERLAALADMDESAQREVQQAYAALDEVLDVRQRARFRVFEDQMERRKLDLLLRARGNARAGRQTDIR